MRELAELEARLERTGYITEQGLVLALALAGELSRPLLVEGEAGAGKTAIAKAFADAYQRPLIRLQCYEGLDVNSAVYEWDYQRQLIAIKLHEGRRGDQELEHQIFSEEYLLKRPLLQAISMAEPPVLLIDEIDRAGDEFEAYLLEVLSDYQISIPELGTIRARSAPFVLLTSNATRELSDALRRRCLYYYLPFPSFEKELRIVNARLPGISRRLAGELVSFVQALRGFELRKKPGVAETLDWAAALVGLRITGLDQERERLAQSLICLLKTREDQLAVNPEMVGRLLAQSLLGADGTRD